MSYSFLRFPNFRKKALTLSYDDNHVYNEKLLKIMETYGLKGTFNLNSGEFAEDTTTTILMLTKAQELFLSPNAEVAVHGTHHQSLGELSVPAIIEEVMTDRKNLEKFFGGRVQGMAYANGSYNDKVVEALKQCGIVYARTINSTERFDIPEDWLRMPATCHHGNKRLMELAEQFLEETPVSHYFFDKPKLFYVWGHGYEFNYYNNWHVIEDFAKYIGNRENVWYATNGEIYEYVQAFDRLVFGVNKDYIYNPSALDVYVCYYGKDVLVPAGKTVRV